MKVITPVAFQTSHLLSTTATETESTYSPTTTYSIGQKVVYGLTDIYESLVDSNLGNQPDTNPTKWLNISPSNKYAMFDGQVNTQTIANSPVIVEIKPDNITNSIAIFNISGATSVVVEYYDSIGGSLVYTKTLQMDATTILDWYMYFFEVYDYRTSIVLLDIPPYVGGYFKITFNSLSTIKIGEVVYGNFVHIGDTQYGVTLGNRDYSIKETDAFGNTTFVKRAFSKRMEPSIMIDNSKLRYINNTLDNIRAIPTVWVATDYDEFDALIVYGFYRDYDIDVSYPTSSLVRISIEGLI